MSKTIEEIKNMVIEAANEGTGEYKGVHGTRLFELDMNVAAMHMTELEQHKEEIDEYKLIIKQMSEIIDTLTDELKEA